MCVHDSQETYDEIRQFGLRDKIIADFMDAPLTEMSLEQIKKDFECPEFGEISEQRLVNIQNYYNGRLALLNQIKSDLQQFEQNANGKFKKTYEILEHYNSFNVYCDEDEIHDKQIEAWISIEEEL